MTERIGLTAVLELGAFSRAVQTYNQAVSGMSKNTASTASSISSSFVGLGSGILKVGAIAAGAGLAGVAALTAGLVLLGSTALTEFAKYERMALSIQSLVARDLAQGQLVEQQRTVAISLTKKEAQELDGLAGKIHDEELARNTLHARIKEQSEALRQLREAHGEEALDVQTATARLAELENQYNKSGAEIQTLKDRQVELTNKTGEYVTVIDKVRTGQMSMTEAMAQAGPKAAELLNWVSKLAIQSPFTEEGVNLAFQTALAYGFNVDEAKRLTEAEVDYAAATGKGVETTNLIALALGQMQAKGKVSGQEIIQLTNAGIGVNRILEDMGFTLDDVSNGLVDSDKFIQAVIDDMNIFEGAAASQASTFSGLISTLSDLKAIGLREFFGGTFRAIQPYLSDFVNGLVSATLETGQIRQLGDTIGGVVAQGLKQVAGFVNVIVSGFRVLSGQKAAVEFFTALRTLGINTGLAKQITDITRSIRGLFVTIQAGFQRVGSAFQTGGFLGAINEIGSMISEAWITTIQPALALWGNNFFNWLLYDVIPAIPGQVTTLVNTISEKLRTGWDFIASTLTGWGYNFFNWVTQTVIPAIPEQMSKIVTGISNYLRENFPSVSEAFDSIVSAIDEGLTKIQGAFTRFGTKGAAISLLGQLGMDPETIGKIDTTLTSITDSISTFVSNVMLAYSRFGGEGAAFSILGQLGVSSDTLVTLKTTLDEIVANVTGFVTRIQEAFASGSEGGGLFGGMSASLKTTAGEILANIPTTLTAITDAIAEHFRTNVPAFQEAMSEWTPKFWEWVNTVVDGASAALAGILLAITDWAFSPEAQNSLNETGEGIGKSIVTGIGLLFDNGVELLKVAIKLAGGLLAAVATITADLIIIGGQVVAGIISGILESLGVDLQPATFSELSAILKQIGKDIVTIAKTLGTKIVNAINDGLVATAKSGVKLGEQLAELMKEAKDILTDPEKWLEIGKGLMEGLLKGLKKNSGIVLEFLKTLVYDSIPDIFTGGWDMQSPSGLTEGYGQNLIQGLTNGAMSASGQLLSSLQGIGQSAINSLMTGMKVTDSGFVDRFIDELDMGGIAKAAGAGGGRWKDIRSIIHQTIRANMGVLEQGGDAGTIIGLIQKQAEKFHLPPSIAVEFAKLNGLVEHLNSTFGAMFQKLRIENLGQSIGVAGQFAGIGSGLADIIKEQAGSGEEVVKTIEAQQKLTAEAEEQAAQLAILQRELDELTTSEGVNQIAVDKKRLAIERATESLGFSERQLAIYRQELATLMQDEAGNALQIEKKTLQIDKQVEAIDAQQKQLVTLQQELEKLTATNELDTASIEKKRKAITDLTKAMAQNQEAITKSEAELRKLANTPAGRLEFFKAFLEGKIKGTDIQGPFGVMKDMLEFEQDGLKVALNRTLVQQEYNRLLEQQKKEQEEIARLEKAQKDLNFLQQQISLLKLISDRGLNPRDIIGGITLGLNASATDLLKVTNNIVQAMVDQINKDLQIGSPSRLMINTFKQVMAGAAIGMERGQSLLSNAVRSIPILNGNIPQPIFNQAGGVSSSVSNTYNYNFPMTVQTAATAPAVVRQYEIKRSMYAN